MTIGVCEVTKVFGTFLSPNNGSLPIMLSGEWIGLEGSRDCDQELSFRLEAEVFVVPLRIQLFSDDARGRAAFQAAQEYALQEERLLSPTGP